VKPVEPAPGAVFELSERAVDFVARAVGTPLDYSMDTLPLLDHWLRQVPEAQPETVRLAAAVAGCYFGEVVRRVIGGAWGDVDHGEPSTWRLLLPGGVSVAPAALATLTVLGRDDGELADDVDATWDVPAPARPAVEAALEQRGAVDSEEFFSLSGRLEVLHLIVDTAVAAAQTPGPPAAGRDEPGNDDDDAS
jgi:hypothetical protein